MISSRALKDIVFEARPIIERQLDDAERIAAFREVVTAQGGDWSSLKALIKAQIQDERDEGKRVEKILAKAEFATGYADMLGWSKMNENNFSADEEDFNPFTGEITESPRKAEEAVSERTATHRPETANEMDREEMRDGRAVHSLAAEKGRKAIPAGPEGVDLNHAGAGEIPATPIAPASHGEAEAPSAERVSPAEGGSAAANTGGYHVDPDHSHAATAGTRINHIVPATPPKTARDFRPHCLKPDACGASGLSHCYSCTKAMQKAEEYA